MNRIANLKAPSGAILSQTDISLLTRMAEVRFVQYHETPFRLKSGILSHVYVHGRNDLTDHPDLEWNVGKKLCHMLRENATTADNQICLLGIPTAGTPFAQATAMVSFRDNIRPNSHDICHRIMKETPKDHGANRGWINGTPNPSHSYWLVDNVTTNGASKPEARTKMLADGYPEPAGVIIWIDRQQGAIAKLQEAGFNRILTAFNLLDITYAYGEMGIWPKDTVKKVEEEIAAHQQ